MSGEPDKMPVYVACTNSDGKPIARGPGNGCGYYSGTLWPQLVWKTMADAERAAGRVGRWRG